MAVLAVAAVMLRRWAVPAEVAAVVGSVEAAAVEVAGVAEVAVGAAAVEALVEVVVAVGSAWEVVAATAEACR